MDKALGSLIIDLQGTELQPDERELIAHPLVGGVIYFSRNYQSPEQIQALTQAVRQVKDKPLLIMVDQEGGRVQRFRQGFTAIPPAAIYGQAYDQDPELGLELAETGGWVMAYELVSKGLDLSLAPILDLDKGVSGVIGNRAFHRNPEIVIKLAGAYIKGMKAAGMAATGKHFPGHGSVAPDSHKELPKDLRSFDELSQDDLLPFLSFIKNKIPALMTAHIVFPAVDGEKPVSYSRLWLQDILRKKLQYQGVIMSDDLEMRGADIDGDYSDRMRLAREAGCDIILLCNNRDAVIQVLDKLPVKGNTLDPSIYQSLRAQFSLADQVGDEKLWMKRRDFLLKHSEFA